MNSASIIEKPSVYDVDQVAGKLGVSTWKVRELVRTGELRSIRIGRLIKVTKEALAEFIEGGGSRG